MSDTRPLRSIWFEEALATISPNSAAAFVNDLIEVTGFKIDMDDSMLKTILNLKKGLLNKNEVVEDYFAVSSQMLELGAYLTDASEAMAKNEIAPTTLYNRVSETYESLHVQLAWMKRKLQSQKKKMNTQLTRLGQLRKITKYSFLATFAAILIGSIITISLAVSPVAAVLTTLLGSVPFAAIGKWCDSMWRKYEMKVRAEKAILTSMQMATEVAISDIGKIRSVVERIEKADAASVGHLGDACTDHVKNGRLTVLQKIMDYPT